MGAHLSKIAGASAVATVAVIGTQTAAYNSWPGMAAIGATVALSLAAAARHMMVMPLYSKGSAAAAIAKETASGFTPAFEGEVTTEEGVDHGRLRVIPASPLAAGDGCLRWFSRSAPHRADPASPTTATVVYDVVFIHGGPSIPPSAPIGGMEALADAMARHVSKLTSSNAEVKVWYYAQRGCGGSTMAGVPDAFDAKDGFMAKMHRLEGGLGIGQQLADIERIKTALRARHAASAQADAPHKFVVVGHSFGGFLAALHCAEFPQSVDALALLAPADVLRIPHPVARGDFFTNVEKRLPESMRDEYRAWRTEYFDLPTALGKDAATLAALDEKFIDYFRAAVGEDGMPPQAARPAGGGPWAARGMFFSMGMEHDWRSIVTARAGMPAVVVHGEEDLQSIGVAQEYAAGLKADVKVTAGAGHWMHITHESFMEGLSEYLVDL